MHLGIYLTLAATVVSPLFSSVTGTQLVNRDISTDVCGEVDGILKVPNLFLPGQYITLGKIGAPSRPT